MHPYLRTRLAVQMFLAGAVTGAWQPVLPTYLQDGLGFSQLQISVALSTVPIATMLAPLLAGQAADRWIASEKLLALLNIGCGVLLLCTGAFKAFPAFIGIFAIAMMFTVPLFSMATSLALMNLPDGARDFPAIRACGTFGHVTGANLLSGWLHLSHRSIADSLVLAGLLAFVSAGYALTLPHTPPSRNAGRSAIGRAAGMLREPGFGLFVGLLFLVSLFGASYYARGPVFLRSSGVSEKALSSLMSIGQITEIPVVLLLPLFYRRFGAKGTMAIGLGAWALRFAFWSRGGSFTPLVIAIALHGICFACGRIAATIYVDRICPRDARASAQSLLSLLVDGSGAFLGNYLIGAVVLHYTVAGVPDWRPIWLVPALGLAAVWAAFVIGFRPRPAAEPALR